MMLGLPMSILCPRCGKRLQETAQEPELEYLCPACGAAFTETLLADECSHPNLQVANLVVEAEVERRIAADDHSNEEPSTDVRPDDEPADEHRPDDEPSDEDRAADRAEEAPA